MQPPSEHGAEPAVPAGGTARTVERDESAPAGGELAPLDRRVLGLWWLSGLLVAAQVLVVVALVDFLAPLPLRRGVLTGAVAAALGLGVAVLPVLRYRRWRYALRERDLWIRHGVLWVTVSVIPYARLQFVDTQQGPLDRLFGLSQLIVHTAALGTSGRLPGLDAAEAERLRERLAAVESRDDATV